MATIRVQNLATGQTGSMEDWDYNPQQFKRLDQQPQVSEPSGGGIGKTLLPLLGSIGGSILGLPFGPGGVIGGGALGGAAGSALSGGSGGDIAKEAAFGGVGGLFPALRVGKAAGAAARVGAEAAAQTAERAGSKLAAKTLASNFIVPSKIGREGFNIENALNQAIQDRTIPGPMSIGGYTKLANTISDAVTKGTRFAANNVKTPINYDQALTDATNFASLQGEIAPDTLERIRNHFIGRNPITSGFISATDAHDVAGQLEKQGFDLIKRYGAKALSPNLALENKGHTFVGVAEDLRNQIANATQNEGLLPQVKQEVLNALGNKFPTVSAKVTVAQSVPEVRSIAAPYVTISRAANYTTSFQQAPFTSGGNRLALTLGGAGAGFGVGNIPGAIAGAAIAPAAAGLAQAATPALTGLATRGILGGAGVATKYGPTVAGQVGSRVLGGLAAPQEAQAAEPNGGENNLIPSETTAKTPQEKLRQALGMAILSRAKSSSDLIAGYNLLYPKQNQLPQELLRAQTGIDVIKQLKQVPQQILNKTGTPEAGIVNAKLNTPGNIGRYFITKKENELASLESQYFVLTQGVLTALQGSRPSDYDAKQYQDKAGPSIQFPNYVNQQRIQNLLQLLQSKVSQSNSGGIPLPAGGL